MVSRRTMLATAAAAAGATAAVIGTAAPASAMRYRDQPGAPTDGSPAPAPVAPSHTSGRIPRTIAASRRVTHGRLRVARTDFRLSHLAVHFTGASAQIRVRTASGWGAWSTISGCDGGRDGTGDLGGSAMLVVPGADGYDVTVSGQAMVVELNTVDGPSLATAAAATFGMPLPGGGVAPVTYLNRAAWGADESYRYRNGVDYWPAEYYPVQTLTVHHTATGVDPDPAGTVRAIYYDQAITKDWGDIGYHLLIDGSGRVYEGRVSGPDGWPVYGPDPGPDGRPLMSDGAHVKYYNAGNIGVCLLGDFTSVQPTPAAVEALTRVLTVLGLLGRLDPLGTTNYVSPKDATKTNTVKTISGHRNWANTACPGNTFYPTLDSVRTAVAARMSAMKPQPPNQRLPSAPQVPLPDGR